MSFFILALLLHIAGGLAISESNLFSATQRPHRPLSLVILEPPESPEDEPELPPEEPKRDEPTGQIVELPPPPEQVPPAEADYLAEFDVTVPKETRAEQFEVNPEVLAPTYSEETKLAQEDLIDLNVEQPSTGAQVGDTIISINGELITSHTQAVTLLKSAQGDVNVLVAPRERATASASV